MKEIVVVKVIHKGKAVRILKELEGMPVWNAIDFLSQIEYALKCTAPKRRRVLGVLAPDKKLVSAKDIEFEKWRFK